MKYNFTSLNSKPVIEKSRHDRIGIFGKMSFCLAGHIYSLYGWGMQMVVSGSQDATAVVWDLRLSSPVSVIPSQSKGLWIIIISGQFTCGHSVFSTLLHNNIACHLIIYIYCYHLASSISSYSNFPVICAFFFVNGLFPPSSLIQLSRDALFAIVSSYGTNVTDVILMTILLNV